MDIVDELAAYFSNASAAPILFAGSGFSRRYLGTPDWDTLLAHFAVLAGNPMEFYRSKANAEYPQISSHIAEDFHPIWFKDQQFAASRNEFSNQCVNLADPLKFEIAQYLAQFANVQDHNEELELLRSVSLEAVITTNYDCFLEQQFDSYEVFDSQNSLILRRNLGVGEIYKIHGCIRSPRSLVLTATDYEQFNSRNIVLAAKLVTLIVEHPVVFMGYSARDQNVHTILTSIVKCLSSEGLERIQDNLTIVEWDAAAQDAVSDRSLRIDNVDLPYRHVKCNSFLPVLRSMAAYTRRFPVKLLRALKEAVYELVQDTEPQGRMVVLDIEEAEDLRTADFVIGIGAKEKLAQVGYKGLGRDEIFTFALEGGDYDAERLIREVLPKLANTRTHVPIFQFLRQAGIDCNDVGAVDALDPNVAALARKRSKDYVHSSYKGQRQSINAQYATFAGLVEALEPQVAINKIALLEESKLDMPQLKAFLLRIRVPIEQMGGSHLSNWRKLVCFYDCLV